MEKVNLKINGKEISVRKGTTVLAAAKSLGINIPTLCYHPMLDTQKAGSCRICVVEQVGRWNLVPSCATPVKEGMEIITDSDKVKRAVTIVLELLIANHPLDCMTCDMAGKCKLQDYCFEYGVKESRFRGGFVKDFPVDESNQFYYRDENKCILCGNCVRMCNDVQCTGAIDSGERGHKNYITAAFDENMENSNCVSCGNCITVCPVGAIVPKNKEKIRQWDITKSVRTTCPYCGVGCQMELLIKNNKVVGVDPVLGKAANDGLLCVKGKFGYNFINHPDRLKSPLIKRDGKFVEVTWQEAYDLIVSKINNTKDKQGKDALAGLASARVSNEETYLIQKMVRAYFGTNNVDHCARLCHASTVAGLATTLGSGAMTNSNQEVLDSEVILNSGSNTTEAHPVLGTFIKKAKKKGAKTIVIEPRKIELAETADIFIQIKPGTNVAIFNGLMNVILEENLQDEEYIKERTENYEELKEIIKDYTPEKVAGICGADADDIRKAARMYASARKAGIYYSMGVTQHSTGTQGVMSVSNLALLCGNIGKESCGVNPLRGQNNVQGACDMGALPGDYPGYQKVYDDNINNKFQDAWGVELSKTAGLTVTEIMKKVEEDEVKFLYIMGENPMISDPDINHVRKALENNDFLVVQDIFLTETAEYADVVLPAASFAEKDGTFTNTERRVQRIRKAVNPPGQAKPDWEILMTIMNIMGTKSKYSGPSDIMDEIASLTPQYGGISYDRIAVEGLQWPCPDKDHPGTKFLHQGQFARGKAIFKPADYIPSAEQTDAEYPYIMTTGRTLYHYHTRTMTGKVEGLNNIQPGSFMQIHPTTANRLGLNDGDTAKVSSRRGEINTKVKVTDIVEEDVVFIPFHFADGPANVLTNPVLDPIAKIPELKVSAVKIEKS